MSLDHPVQEQETQPSTSCDGDGDRRGDADDLEQNDNGEQQRQQNQDDKEVRYRQYLIDRTNGNSRLADSKPPCSACMVPMPVVWFSSLIEQNCVFEKLGSFGIFDASNEKARKICIGLGLICNVLGAGLSLYVLFATSTKYSLIWASAFTKGSIRSNAGDVLPLYFRLRLGLKALAVETYHMDLKEVITEEVIPFNQFCNISNAILPPDGNEETCGDCDKASSSMIFTLYVSFFMSIPSITTSILRLYPYYDCNCQKVFASFAAAISVAFAIYTFVIYQFRCFRSVSSGRTVCVSPDGVYFPQDDGPCYPDPNYYRLFSAGPGWIALAISVGFKILDMLFNMAIPTPTICRDREEQRLYEALAMQQEENDVDKCAED